MRDSILDPETVKRLTAVRKFVEKSDAPFPPAPLQQEVPRPLYGGVHMDLEWWKQRHINVITWSAIEMLYTESQLKHYREDMDVPR